MKQQQYTVESKPLLFSCSCLLPTRPQGSSKRKINILCQPVATMLCDLIKKRITAAPSAPLPAVWQSIDPQVVADIAIAIMDLEDDSSKFLNVLQDEIVVEMVEPDLQELAVDQVTRRANPQILPSSCRQGKTRSCRSSSIVRRWRPSNHSSLESSWRHYGLLPRMICSTRC